jgi:hypothetical protein
MAVPSSARRITNLDRFRQAVLLHLLKRADLRLISVWHPSFLSLLLDTLARDWELLLAQLSLECPARATALRAANPNQPPTIWPNLRLVSCWADAHARGPAEELRRRLPGVTLQPKGLLATEGCITLPFAGCLPVAVHSHFFEFADESGGVHPLQDLRLGDCYEVILTTGGGLWRYRLGDQVEVTGFVERTPTLKFLGRSGNVSDRCGEKLAEAFVIDVLRSVCPTAHFAMLAPERAGDVWRYVLYLENGDATHSELSRVRLDAALSANPHYALCRRLGQLGEPLVVCVSGNAYARFTAAEMARGMRLGGIKPVALSQHTDWHTHLQSGFPAVSESESRL